MTTPHEDDSEQTIRSRVGLTRRAILAALGAGGLSVTVATGAGDDNHEKGDGGDGGGGGDGGDSDENGDDEDEGPSFVKIEISESHGDSPGEYEPTDTVRDDDFHVPFSARGIEEGGSFHAAIVNPETNEVKAVESGQFAGAKFVHGWPEFNRCGILTCWDPGTYRAVVTATNTATEQSVTGSTEFQIRG